MRRVAIIHPWMPQYRIAFFTELKENLIKQGVDLDIFYGTTPPEWDARQDNVHPTIAKNLNTQFIKIGKRNISIKSLALLRDQRYDLIILEQAIRNIETYQLLLNRGTREKIAFWGHGKTYTKSKNMLEEKFKYKLTKMGVWFFGYTEEGVDTMVAEGFSASRTTVVQNSIDTTELSEHLDAVSQSEIDSFTSKHDLTRGHTALHLGGIDSAKRIEFLLEAGALISKSDPHFRLVFVGAGDQADVVDRWQEDTHWVQRIGPTFGMNKAIALKSSDFMLNPGRVGLIAVDSLTSGRPIVTTQWPYHAPEISYLKNQYTMIQTANTVEAVAAEVRHLIQSPNILTQLQRACLSEANQYSASSMAERFAAGIKKALI